MPTPRVAKQADSYQLTHFMLNGHIQVFVSRLRLCNDPRHTVPYCDDVTANVFVINFAHRCRAIDRFFVLRLSPMPIERHLHTRRKSLHSCAHAYINVIDQPTHIEAARAHWLPGSLAFQLEKQHVDL